MLWLSVASLLVGVWLVIDSQEAPSATLTLILGVTVCVLAVLSLVGVSPPRRD